MPTCLRIFALFCIFAAPPSAFAVENMLDMKARDAFGLLPITIFENTVEGLDEGEKQQLLTTGQTEFWQLADETADSLLFSALPFHDSAVTLRLFHEENGDFCLAAVGAVGGPLCTLEFWKMDSAGRIVPVAGPPEPDIKDFLHAGQILPKGLQPATVLCLDFDSLAARPLFWSATGLVDLPVPNTVRYLWNGRDFEKQVSPKTGP
ncbi:MAG: hypothetical protein LBR31_05625 [Desulfovibrio sp.]|jgi:hypothetical protein|nr:hypothetical protein [Desulfovibrio sp.]